MYLAARKSQKWRRSTTTVRIVWVHNVLENADENVFVSMYEWPFSMCVNSKEGQNTPQRSYQAWDISARAPAWYNPVRAPARCWNAGAADF